jgi:peptide/nickel transport system permease protein
VMLAAATLSFLTLQLMPGDPVDTLLRGTFEITPEMRADVASAYGLDEPVWLQYLQYVGGLVVGDLGVSYQQRQPVTEIIAVALPPTAALTGLAMLLAVVFAVVGALVSAGRGRVARFAAQTLELLAISVPSFWIGLLLLSAFAFAIPLFPSTGAEGFSSLVLPALTLSLPLAGVLGQILRERLDDSLEQPHTLTARTRGAGEARVRVRHGLRHSVIPALTVSGAIIGSLLVGTTVIETLFSRPGIGRVLLTAVMSKDAPVIMGVVVFAAIVFLVVNTAVDLLYLVVDPRTRESGTV